MIHICEPKLESLLEIQKQELTDKQRHALENQITRHRKALEAETD